MTPPLLVAAVERKSTIVAGGFSIKSGNREGPKEVALAGLSSGSRLDTMFVE